MADVTKLAVVLVAVGLVAGAAAVLLGGLVEGVRLAAAAGVCLPIGLASLLAGRWSIGRGPAWQVGILLGGAGVRIPVAMAAGLVLAWRFPILDATSFWIWMALAYLVMLGVEVILLMGSLPGATIIPKRLA